VPWEARVHGENATRGEVNASIYALLPYAPIAALTAISRPAGVWAAWNATCPAPAAASFCARSTAFSAIPDVRNVMSTFCTPTMLAIDSNTHRTAAAHIRNDTSLFSWVAIEAVQIPDDPVPGGPIAKKMQAPICIVNVQKKQPYLPRKATQKKGRRRRKVNPRNDDQNPDMM
jgi:hypothetical protein